MAEKANIDKKVSDMKKYIENYKKSIIEIEKEIKVIKCFDKM